MNTGLLRAVKRPEELAGVLAHELAHVTQRHGFRMMIDAAGLSLIVRTFLGDSSGLQAMIANSSQLLLRQKFSRDFEREADEIGWQYLVRARIDPRGMIDFFKTLQGEQAKDSSLDGSLAFLSTHPPTAERIQRMQAQWDRLERKSGFVEFDRPKP